MKRLVFFYNILYKHKTFLSVGVLTVIWILFFNKSIFFNKIPFPGDLLISEYQPWKSYSFLGYNPGSYPSKVQYSDTIRQILPWKLFAASQLKQGEIPLWNPYNFSGHPLLANSQSGVFYPFTLLFIIFSASIAWTLYIAFQTLLCSIFTFWYCRKTKMSRMASLFAATAFSYSLFSSVFLEYGNIIHTYLWLPCIAGAVESFLQTKQMRWIAVISFSTVMMAIAGHLQIFGFSLLFLLLYSIFRVTCLNKTMKAKLLSGVCIISGFIVGIGLSAFQLLPTFELIGYAARIPQSYENMVNNLLIQPWQLILFLIPDFFGNPVSRNYFLTDSYPGNSLYIGVVLTFLVLYSINKLKNSFNLFYASATAVLLGLFLRTPLTEWIYRFEIPLVSTGSPTNGIFLL